MSSKSIEPGRQAGRQPSSRSGRFSPCFPQYRCVVLVSQRALANIQLVAATAAVVVARLAEGDFSRMIRPFIRPFVCLLSYPLRFGSAEAKQPMERNLYMDIRMHTVSFVRSLAS